MGWGVHLEGDMLQGKWDPQERLHISLPEMRVVAKTLLGFSLPTGFTALVSLNISTIVSYINREGGMCSLSLWKETKHFIQLVINLQSSTSQKK